MAKKALVPTTGAALWSTLSVSRTRHSVPTLTPAPAVGHSLIVRKNSRAFHQPADMITVAESVMPASIGAGSVLLIRHLVRALSAPAPAEILGAAVSPADLRVTALIRRRYYRSIVSFIPTLLLISGFVLGAVIPALLWLNKPIPTVEAPMLTGLVCGLVAWVGEWLDRKLWERYFASATASTLVAN